MLASEESKEAAPSSCKIVIASFVVVAGSPSTPVGSSGCDSGASSPVPVLPVRDDGDNDDTVVGDDDEDAEISTSVDSSSSSAPMDGKTDDGVVVVVVVVVVVSIVSAVVCATLVGSMLIFCACALCIPGLSQLFTLVLFIHYARRGRLPFESGARFVRRPSSSLSSSYFSHSLLCVYVANSCYAFRIR